MGIFSKLKGTQETTWRIGDATGVVLKRISASILSFFQNDETTYLETRGASVSATKTYPLVTLAELKQHITIFDGIGIYPDIQGGFTGSTAGMASVNATGIWLCQTTGDLYTAGDLVYCTNTTGPVVSLVPPSLGKHVSTIAALTSGTINLDATSSYVRTGAYGRTYTKLSDTTAAVGTKYIMVDLADTSQSTTALVDGDIITEVIVNVTDGFDSNTCTITVAGSSPLTIFNASGGDGDVTQVNQYIVPGVFAIDSTTAGVLKVSSTTNGAGKAYVVCGTPNS